MVKHSALLLTVAAFVFSDGAVQSVRAQGNSFVPPASIKKYPFYPQGGNFFVDLFPTNFVDVDSTTGILAYNGSDYTYDGHNGIDSQVVGFAAQDVGVPIFAALDGTVIEAHDGEFDRNTMFNSLPANYVKIDHGNGQTTTYFHMKKDSVAVVVGQQVTAGQQIGLTASSGNSTAPHLHFQSEFNGVVYEPFSGSARPGLSGWVSQPPFRADLYLMALVITDQDLSTWAGFPFDTTRTGTFFTGVHPVNTWFLIGNGEGITSLALRYLRPDGSVALSTGDVPINNAVQLSYFYLDISPNLDVVGTWTLELLVNGEVLADAPFQVLSPGSPVVNQPPAAIEASFDPAVPSFADAVFSRITSPTVLLDPDYDFVRYTYLWKVNGVVVRNVTSAGLADALSHDKIHVGDELSCTITPSDGMANGPATTVTTTVTNGQPLLNISTRLIVQTGDNVLIGGFIITGTDPKKVIIRAIGPSLPIGGTPVLADPVLELHKPDGTVVTNDNWRDTQEQEVIDSTIPPTNNLESAIVATLPPGAYTAVVSGKNGGTGVALVEAYDLDQLASSQLANISTRGSVETGDNVMIGGFIIGGENSPTVVVRAIGPSLGAQGVSAPLQDPTLELHDAEGAQIAFDDDWKDSQQAQIVNAQLAPSDDHESAIQADLMPGAYTAIVRGKANGTGVGLVEVYNLQ